MLVKRPMTPCRELGRGITSFTSFSFGVSTWSPIDGGLVTVRLLKLGEVVGDNLGDAGPLLLGVLLHPLQQVLVDAKIQPRLLGLLHQSTNRESLELNVE